MNYRKVLLVGGYGLGNLGDEAILAGLLKIFTNDRKVEKNEILVFSSDPHETVLLHKVHAKTKNLLDFLLSTEIIIGGGELIQDLGNDAIKYPILGLAGKILRKRVTFYAVGVSEVRSRLGKFFSRIGLSVADDISVRDSLSIERLRRLGINKSVTVVEDPAMFVRPVSRQSASDLLEEEGVELGEKKFLIGITSQYIYDKKINVQLHEFLLSFLKCLLTRHTNAYVVFIPFNNHKAFAIDRDVVYGRLLGKRLNIERFKVISGRYTPQETMGMVQLMDLVISTRLHPLIFASKVNVPRIGIDIFEKVAGFSERHKLPVVKLGDLEGLTCLTENIINHKLKED